MWEILIPDLYVKGITSIPLNQLLGWGTKGLIVDFDNTVTEWNATMVSAEVGNWIKAVRELGIMMCLTSNNRGPHIETIASQLGVAAVTGAGKPRRGGLRRALAILGTTPAETVVIGDQIFTDVLAGHRMGMRVILVQPLSRREFIGTRLMRVGERLLLKRLALKEDW